LADPRRDGGTNSTLRTKEQGTQLTLNEHDDDDDDDDDDKMYVVVSSKILFEIFLILKRVQRVIITYVQRYSCEVVVFIVRFS